MMSFCAPSLDLGDLSRSSVRPVQQGVLLFAGTLFLQCEILVSFQAPDLRQNRSLP